MFHATEVDFLGMIVRCDRIKMDQEKVKAILEWPEPKTVKGVRSFLRLANFYPRFIKDYAKVARPLHDLMKKENPFHWEEPQQVVFDTLKLHFTTAPILAFPDIDCVFRLKSNASDYATGAVLSIEKEGVCHPAAFSSHSMMPQERNSLIADKEMLSVIQALEQWRHYLEGARHQFEIWNDHANLQWFMQRQDLNQRQVCWAQYLSRFNAVWCYKPRPSMGKPNALSRREDHAEGIEDDNKGVIVITLDKIRTTILIMDEGDSLKQKIFNATCLLSEADV